LGPEARRGAQWFAALAKSGVTAARADPAKWRISAGANASSQTPPISKPVPTPPNSHPVFGSTRSAGKPDPGKWRISRNPKWPPQGSSQTPPISEPLRTALQGEISTNRETPHWTPLPPRPYRPIQLQTDRDYGTQQKAAVLSTDYARQAAEMLIDNHKGHLDCSQIPQMLDDLKNDKDLPTHHREHLTRTLNRLQDNRELAAVINTVCEHKPLRGPAADMVRATLNLRPDVKPDAREARKALVMALLGSLRQTEVDSCFVTAPAICLLNSSPEIVARQMRELLEDNKLTIHKEGLAFDVPLNQRTSRAHAQVALSVQADGTCYDTAGGLWHAPYKLHEAPGMQGALTALGVAPDDREQAVITALGEISASGHELDNVSCQHILEQLARKCPSPGKALACAINAFAGKEDVRLLRAWEYTLASTDEIHFNARKIASITAVPLYGGPVAGKPELQSLASKDYAFRSWLQSHPRFAAAPIQQISNEQFTDIMVLMQQRLCMLYDADADQKTISADGVSGRGGFMLYARTPPDDPSKWQRIDNPVKFQATMGDLVNEASRETRALLWEIPGNRETNSEVLERTTQHLLDCIQDNSFIEHVEHSVPHDSDGPQLPWTPRRGGDGQLLVEDLGGQYEWFANGDTSIQPHPIEASIADGPKKPGDATHVIEFFCGALKEMEQALGKASTTYPDFRVPVTSHDHAFTLMPAAFKDAWKDGNGNPQQWIDDKLKKPAMHHLNAQRTKPSLFELLDSLGEKLGDDHLWKVKDLYQQIVQIGPGGESYSLRRVHQALAKYCRPDQDDALLLEQAEDLLAAMVPVPAIPFADTNWSSEAGEALLVEASYNPFKERVEANIVSDGGSIRSPLEQSWLDNYWRLSTPLMPAA
jgi:hypothetical protein